MKPKILIGCLFVISFLNANEVKEAFDAGIKSTVNVLNHEKKQQTIKIDNNYCLSVKNENSQLDDKSIIKLETLGLLLGYKPSLLYSDDKSKILCLTIQPTIKDAQKELKKIKTKYSKIDKFFPKVVLLGDSSYKRGIPVIGVIHKDMTNELDALSERIVELKKQIDKQKETNIDSLKSKVQKLQEALNESKSKENYYKQSLQRIKDKINNLLGGNGDRSELLEIGFKQEPKVPNISRVVLLDKDAKTVSKVSKPEPQKKDPNVIIKQGKKIWVDPNSPDIMILKD